MEQKKVRKKKEELRCEEWKISNGVCIITKHVMSYRIGHA